MLKIKSVSVYVPAYNAARTIDKCLEGILKQTYPVDEIIIVDDGSTDNTSKIASKYNVKIIKHSFNKGIAASRNTAILNAKNDFVASLDADCIPTPDWLSKLMRNFTPLEKDTTMLSQGGRNSESSLTGFTHDDIAGVSGKLVEFFKDSIPDKWRTSHMKQHWGDEKKLNPLHLFGNNTVFRKKAIASVGFYEQSPKYRTNNEDYYISRKLINFGYKIIYDPEALVVHYRKDTLNSLFRTYWMWFFLHRVCPNSIKNLLKKFMENIHWAKKYIKEDYIQKRKIQILIDFIFIFYQFYFDLRYFIFKKKHSLIDIITLKKINIFKKDRLGRIIRNKKLICGVLNRELAFTTPEIIAIELVGKYENNNMLEKYYLTFSVIKKFLDSISRFNLSYIYI